MKFLIQTPTNKLQNSIEFYSKLNFKTLSEDNPLIVTDGKAVIEINPDRFSRSGIKLFKNSWADEVSQLLEIVAVNPIKDGYLLSDPSGTWICLMETDPQPIFDPDENSFSILGNYAGMGFETTDINKSGKILEILGFSVTMGSVEQGWVTFGNKDLMISLFKPFSCPHLFFNPSLTYFNGKKNVEIIEKIRALNIPIAEEITVFNKEGNVDNIIIRDPGGLGFFIFND
jgi:hypothetical protein